MTCSGIFNFSLLAEQVSTTSPLLPGLDTPTSTIVQQTVMPDSTSQQIVSPVTTSLSK